MAQKVMATVQIIFGIAPAIAPMVGGLLLNFNWQSIFIFLVIYSILITFFSTRFLPETVDEKDRLPFNMHSVLTRYKNLLIDNNFIFLVLAVSFNFSAFFLYVLASPIFLVDHLGLNSSQFGYLFIPTVTGMILGSFISKRTAGIVSPDKLLKFAYTWMILIASVNVFFCYFFQNILWINIGFVALYNVGMASAMPLISIKALDCFPKARGTAASGQAFSQMFISSIVAGVVVPLVWGSTFTLSCAMLFIFLLGYFSITKTQSWNDNKSFLN
jgi:DHA1 family bicyclomycin/chloramphenicol resistance-like MFS transporter